MSHHCKNLLTRNWRCHKRIPQVKWQQPQARRMATTPLLGIRLQQNRHLFEAKPFLRLINPTYSIVRGLTSRPYVDPTLSYAFGKSSEHLIHSTIAREFDKQVRERPDDVGFISHFEDKQATFKEIKHDVEKLSKALIKRFNIKKGDSVGVFAYNCYNWIVIQLACSQVGAVLVPINPSYKSSELLFILEKSKVKCLFMPGPMSVQSELNDHINILQSEKIVAKSRSSELDLRHVVFVDSENEYEILGESTASKGSTIGLKLANCEIHNWSATENDGQTFSSIEDAIEAGVSEEDACIINTDSLSPDDVFAVYYTSGTTGQPKGASISQFTVVNNVNLCQIRLRTGRPRNWKVITVTTLPMFHIFAGVLNTLGPIMNNSVVVYSSYKYDIKAFVEAIYKYQSNFITLTPTILIDMLSYIERNKLTDSPLKVVQPGGAHIQPEVINRTFKTLPNLEEVRVGYGSTENGSVATFQTIHEPSESRHSTVGPPLDFTEVRIVKPNTEEVVQHGVRGEIQTRGHNTMIEYLGQPEKTAEVITPTMWYKTGDVGFMHPHGSITICGRLKHLIIKGGENIYPEEVAQLIHTLDYVEDVHVVGVPDKRFGEQVCAWVKLKPGYAELKEKEKRTSDKEIHKDDVIEFCKEHITYFKVPKYLLFVDDFPMTPTKKMQSHIMTEKSIKILGLEDQI